MEVIGRTLKEEIDEILGNHNISVRCIIKNSIANCIQVKLINFISLSVY
jgi:hypothetical protein